MITQERLKELFIYDRDTGVFIRKISRGRSKKGSIAGYENRPFGDDSYIRICIKIDGKQYLAHKLVWLYEFGEYPSLEIDHRNQKPKDNRLNNLRLVTRSESMKNRSLYKVNKSGHSGVFYNKRDKVWSARISDNGVKVNLGDFKYKEDAIKARKQAELDYCYHENHGSHK